jgi:hypothetical protein
MQTWFDRFTLTPNHDKILKELLWFQHFKTGILFPSSLSGARLPECQPSGRSFHEH